MCLWCEKEKVVKIITWNLEVLVNSAVMAEQEKKIPVCEECAGYVLRALSLIENAS